MLVREARKRPDPWTEYRQSIPHRWLLPLYTVEFAFEWTAYFLSKWAFLEVLEYLGILSVLFAVIFYYSEAGDRQKQKHYQAWQVINTAQGKGGSGGRIEALQELNADGIPLVGVDVSGSFLQGVQLPRAKLLRADLGAADLRDSDLQGSDLEYAHLTSANFRGADLRFVNLLQADLENADLVGATLAGADLSHTNLKNADLRKTNLQGIRWQAIAAIDSANLYGVRNAPAGFVAWALQHGAISVRIDDD
jgi:hypothetical protein